MICTNTHHYVNILSTIKKKKRKKMYHQRLHILLNLCKCRLILNWSLYKNLYFNDYIEVIVIREIWAILSFVGINKGKVYLP